MDRCNGINAKGLRCNKYALTQTCNVHSNQTLEDCGICLETINDYSPDILILECDHIFCKKCIYTWMISKGESICKCPLCRKPIHGVYKNDCNLWGVENDILQIVDTIIYPLEYLEFEEMLTIMSVFPPGVQTNEVFINRCTNASRKDIPAIEKLKLNSYTKPCFITKSDFLDKPFHKIL